MPFIPDILRSLGGEREAPSLFISPESERVLHDIISAKNPSLDLIPFLATGVQGEIDSIYSTLPNPDRQGIHYRGGNRYGISMEPKVLEELFRLVDHDKGLENIVMFGMVYPSGRASLAGLQLTLPPGDYLLDAGFESINYLRALLEMNPSLKIPYSAIAANTNEGPKIRIRATAHLLKATKYEHIENIPSQTIRLSHQEKLEQSKR